MLPGMKRSAAPPAPRKSRWKQFPVFFVFVSVALLLMVLVQLGMSRSASHTSPFLDSLSQPKRVVRPSSPQQHDAKANDPSTVETATAVNKTVDEPIRPQPPLETTPGSVDQQAAIVANKALYEFRIQRSTIPSEKSNTFALELPLVNTTSMPHWQQTIVYKQAASERLARGGDAAAPLPVAPRSIHRLNDAVTTIDSRSNNKPILSIITATRSHNELNVSVTDLQKRLIYSIIKTITPAEQKLWNIQLWIGVDDVDEWWVRNWAHLNAPAWLDVYIAIIPDKIHRVPFTEVAYASYTSETPPDYMVRVNDDTEFLTPWWLTLAAAKLQSYDPPNVGVVGPECQAGNTMILTHDFVHATHMEIFQGYYYPTVFRNWYLDDWISTVYSDKVLGGKFHRKSVMVKQWKVKHWISASSYVPHVVDAQWLPTEYELGRKQIRDYVMAIDEAKGSNISEALPFIRDFELLQAVKQYLPPDGNLLVWGISMEESPSLHRVTSGRVQFLGDEDPSRYFLMKVGTATRRKAANDYVHGNYPFLAVHGTVLKLRGDWNHTFDTYFKGQTLENNTNWCDLQIPLFPRNLFASDWDVIVVRDQGGVGGVDQPGAGIFQPLYNSLLLTANQTASNQGFKTPHILISNFDRQFERETALQTFGREPDNVALNNSVGVYSIGKDDSSFGWVPHCPRPLLRLTRKYPGPWSKAQLLKGMEVIQPKDNVLFFGISNFPQYWHYATEGEVLFLENAINATRIQWLLNDHPEIAILPVNYTSHDVHEDRIAATQWDVLVLEPFERDRTAVLHEIERLKDIILRPGLKVIVSNYHIADYAESNRNLFGGEPWATAVKGSKKKQEIAAYFTIR